MSTIINRVSVSDSEDLYEVIRDSVGWSIIHNETDTQHGTRTWESVDIETPEITVSLSDDVIDSCLVAKRQLSLGNDGGIFGLQIKLLELVPDPDHPKDRWLGTFLVESS